MSDMSNMAAKERPHRRYNPLNGEWIIVSPQRSKRPWQSAAAKEAPKSADYDAKCFLCPGNERSSLNNEGDKKVINPDYEDIFVFDNDFPCLIDMGDMAAGSAPKQSVGNSDKLFVQQSISGTCRVICYSKYHNLNLGDMPDAKILKVVEEWIKQLNELGQKYAYVQIFESKGEIVGCSSQHPHGQIWALDYIPHLVEQENMRQEAYYNEHGSVLLLDYLQQEEQNQERIVLSNEHWVVLVPYWAYWPYETMLLPRRSVSSLLELNGDEKESLATTLKQLVNLYDKLFGVSFPYRMGWHTAAQVGQSEQGDKSGQKAKSEGDNTNNKHAKYTKYVRGQQLHCHFYPPLLDRVRQKYTAGFEVSAELQRDITPEQAASSLRELV